MKYLRILFLFSMFSVLLSSCAIKLFHNSANTGTHVHYGDFSASWRNAISDSAFCTQYLDSCAFGTKLDTLTAEVINAGSEFELWPVQTQCAEIWYAMRRNLTRELRWLGPIKVF
mgnify:CR=1 FL=1